MEAKDTVMAIRKSVELPEDRSLLNMLDFTDKVAEISFKAGQQSIIDLALKLHILCKGDDPDNTACKCKEFWEEIRKC